MREVGKRSKGRNWKSFDSQNVFFGTLKVLFFLHESRRRSAHNFRKSFN